MLRAFAIALMVAVVVGGSDAAIVQLDVKTYEFGKNAYGFHGMPGNRLITTFQAENEATLVFRKIIGAQGISARVEIRASGDVDNAAAFVDATGVRIIAYNAIFMDEVLKKTGRYWSLMSIMAHEVGHHLNFHTYVSATGLPPDQLRKDELEADYFSGHALARLGATLDDALAAMRAISPAIEHELKAQDLSLKVYDCYRPPQAVRAFVAWAKSAPDDRAKKRFHPRLKKIQLLSEGYIASQSAHSRGIAVDAALVPLPLAEAASVNPDLPYDDCAPGKERRGPDNALDFGTGFDCFDVRSHTGAKNLTKEQRSLRERLVSAMTKHGFRNYEREWWHFTLVTKVLGKVSTRPLPNLHIAKVRKE